MVALERGLQRTCKTFAASTKGRRRDDEPIGRVTHDAHQRRQALDSSMDLDQLEAAATSFSRLIAACAPDQRRLAHGRALPQSSALLAGSPRAKRCVFSTKVATRRSRAGSKVAAVDARDGASVARRRADEGLCRLEVSFAVRRALRAQAPGDAAEKVGSFSRKGIQFN